MKRTNKKGFTIVELVIVIAVIAILAAVLIPNISKLVQKANTSADESLVRNLNTALSMDVEKHTTMSAALKAAKDNGGYDLETIELKGKGNKILWDSVNDCFVYLKGTDRVYLPNTQSVKKADKMEKYEYFEILEKMPTAEEMKKQEYSIYLAGKADIGGVEVSVGFDVGANKASKVTLNTSTETKENSSFLIYTNGGELVVKADNAAVEHYGEATIVTINAVAMNSYHENGTVNEIKLAQGRVVVEAKAEVGSVLVTAKSNTKAKVEVKASAKLGAIGADNNQVELSKIVSGAENTEIMDTPVTNTGFAGGFGTEKAPYLIATAEQFAKIGEYSAEMVDVSLYFALIDNIDLSSITFSNSYVALVFQGTLNGNGHNIVSNDKLTSLFCYSMGDVCYKDFTIVLKNELMRVTNSAALHSESDVIKLVYDNVDVKGVVNAKYNLGGDNSAYYANGTFCSAKVINASESTITIGNGVWTQNQYVEIANCDVYVDFTMVGDRAAVFCGGQVYSMHITITDSTYSGTFYGANPGLVFANHSFSSGENLVGSIDLKNVSLLGRLVCLNSISAHGLSFANNAEELVGVSGAQNIVNCTSDETMNIVANENGLYVITAAKDSLVDSYLVQLSLGKLKWYDVDGNLTDIESSNHMISIAVSGDLISSAEIYKCAAYSKKQAEKANIDLTDATWNISEEGSRYSFVNFNGTKILVLDIEGEFVDTEKQNVANIIGIIGDMPKYYKRGA